MSPDTGAKSTMRVAGRNNGRQKIRDAGLGVHTSNKIGREDIGRLLPKAAALIGPMADAETVMRIWRRNPDSVWLLQHALSEHPDGFQASLLLNSSGRAALLAGRLDLRNPPIELIAAQTEVPALIYVWAVFAPGRLAAGLPHVVDRFASPHYAKTDVAASARTVAGTRAIARLGFKPWAEAGRADLFIVQRSAASHAALRPRYDRYDPVTCRTGIKVAHSIDEILQVAVIRAAVFLGEQDCPYYEEFDGNDFTATHLISYFEGEPAGCMRIRYFGDFAKMERLAVRREFRRTTTAFQLVRASVEFCRAKGFRKLYGHARRDLLPFWQRFGFKVRQNGEPFAFSDLTFVEMVDDIEPTVDAVNLNDGPYRTIRPEGRWHIPGVLEQSAARGST